MRGDLGQRVQAAPVALDGDDARGAGGKQRPRQPARTGPHLDHGHPGEVAGGAGDARRQVEIEQEILAECLQRRQPVPRDHLAKRREIVDMAHAMASLRQSSAARHRAAARLAGFAFPDPAMSSAVP